MFVDVALPGPIALVPARQLDAKLQKQTADWPGSVPNGVTQVAADLNRDPRGVPATLSEPRKGGGSRSLRLYTRTYVVVLYASREGDAYTVAAISPLGLRDHDTLARGCLLLRSSWSPVAELRLVPRGSHARWDRIQQGWSVLVQRLGGEQVLPTRNAKHLDFLDTLDRLIDKTQEITGGRSAGEPGYPHRSVEPVGERRYTGSAFYAFQLVGDRVPERNRFVAVRGESGRRGQVVRAEAARVVVRFDGSVDWAQLPQQGQLEVTTSNIVFTTQRKAVEALRTGQARNRSLLSVLVDHQVRALEVVPDTPAEELDEDQIEAFRRALGVRDMLVVLGPPGTGKTRTISQIARSCAVTPGRGPVLVASHTNKAVDNVLAKLSRDVVVVRVGNEGKIDRDGIPFLLERQAAELREEITRSVGEALRGYRQLPLARQWADELARRIGALAAALATATVAQEELERVRRAVGGPAQARVETLSAEVVQQEHQVRRHAARLERVMRRDARASARRWWPPLAGWARAARRARVRRIEARRADLAGATELAARQRAAIADAQRTAHAMTRDDPRVRAADQELHLAQQHVAEATAGVGEARSVIGTVIAPVANLPESATGDPATAVRNLWALHTWIGQQLDVLEGRAKLLTEWSKEISGEVEQLYPELIRYADVIGATCVGAGSRDEIAEVEFDLAIVDEAGQIGTADVLVPLARAKRSVLVGDHRQLPPFLDTDVGEWGVGTGDERIRTLLTTSALEILVDELPASHVVRLTRQRRMPRVIADFVSDMFYGGTLRTTVERAHDPSLFASPLAFVDTSGLPQQHRNESPAPRANGQRRGCVNHAEAQMLTMLAEYFHRRGVEWALIVPYAAQAELISTTLREQLGAPDTVDSSVGTVDSFQGGERDVVLYGFTRSNSAGKVGFLDELRRANVAFTRARRQLVLVGDMHMLLRATNDRFRRLARSLRDHVAATGDVHRYAELVATLEGLRE
ncbi:DEAD/DEAH box helicase [Amycolatopsis suaedae]|uniref:Helicase n=1 Tax=Amycolatopsis suaedae TaxID=2510978 RepID=A0A4Q7JDU2_9PSEU|nr:AAA domain-containing protein [Amycolatopsis suaedae]RZQ64823.1 hypothetical protein EWH70_08035 [Amycolatopsis suaedae]